MKFDCQVLFSLRTVQVKVMADFQTSQRAQKTMKQRWELHVYLTSMFMCKLLFYNPEESKKAIFVRNCHCGKDK